MQSAKEIQDYLKWFEESKVKFPNAHIVQTVKKLNVDMNKLAKENSYLFTMFTRIFSGEATPQTLQLWANYQQAYKELKDNGYLNVRGNRKQQMETMVNDFKSKVDGPFLVPLSEIEDLVTEKKKRGVVSIQVEFNEYMDLLEKYYDFEHRDFFGSFKNRYQVSGKDIGISEEEFKKAWEMAPADNINAVKISIFNDINNQKNGFPYVDCWHHLLEHEFAEISNGSVAYLYNEDEDFSSKECYDENVKFDPNIFKYFRQLIFKEISQLPFYKGNDVEEIEFHIWW